MIYTGKPAELRAKILWQDLEAGEVYTVTLEHGAPGTDDQNRTFHGLLSEFLPMSSDADFDTLRARVLIEYSGRAKTFVRRVAIPDGSTMAVDVTVPPSWGALKRSERAAVIDGVLREMGQAGATGGRIFQHLLGVL